VKLMDYRFDTIMVSPTWRTRQTILPYLKAHGRTAEIWPEIEECCCDARGDAPPATEIPPGEKIVIGEADSACFKLRDETAAVRFAPTTEAEGLGQMRRACDLIRTRFGGSDKSVLVVTHSCSGTRIIEELLGLKMAGRFPVDNASLTHLRQGDDGSFQLVALNGQPFQAQYVWRPAATEPPRPGNPLTFTLTPRYFVQTGPEPCRVAWRLLNAKQEVVEHGSEEFGNISRDAQRVLDLSVGTDGAALGDVWTFESSAYAGDTMIQQWTNRFLFPSYLPLPAVWRIRSGDDAAWSAVDCPDDSWVQTSVPGGWEKDALPNYDGTAWYRVRFTVPGESTNRWGPVPLAILLGAVDDADEAFLNGRKIGAMGEFPPAQVTAWDQPRVYEFDSSLLTETNVLALRVSDWGGGGGIWKGPVAIGPAAELRTAAEIAK
jgi:broad specificity phosphatase PhoE